MRLNELIMVVAVLGMTVGVAAAEENKSASETTAVKEAPAVAEATPTEQVEAAPAPVRHVDPVEAALARAMAISEAPAPAPAKFRSKRKQRDRGLTGLKKFAASASKIDINAWTHSSKVPVDEPVVHMAVQPLTKVQVSTVIKANLAKFQYCRQRLAARGAAAAGEVSLRFTVLPKGRPVDVQVIAGGPNAGELARCMERRIRAFRFPAADAPTPVDYPLVFDVASDL